MISQEQYDDLSKRIKEAWSSDITPFMKETLRAGSYALVTAMKISLFDILSPDKIIKMIDDSNITELKAMAEKAKVRQAFIDEVIDIKRKNDLSRRSKVVFDEKGPGVHLVS